jgi:predicted metal-dependent HD superfamily phosphohydrolase
MEEHEALLADLCAAYDDPGRRYHDTRHLTEVFDRLVELAPSVPFDRQPVLLAAWFHDAVYDGRPDAEERSAEWALSALAGHPDVAEVARLIRITAHHQPDPGDINGCALTDADLGILAAPPERYISYASAVREEFAHLSDADFATGRASILTSLLVPPALFHTDYAREHWEAPARANAEREVSELVRR